MTQLKMLSLSGVALGALAALLAPNTGFAQEPPRSIDTSAYGKPGADCAELRDADFSTVDEAITEITDARRAMYVGGLSSTNNKNNIREKHPPRVADSQS